MNIIYDLLRAFLDPVVFVLILIAMEFLISFKNEKKQSGRIALLVVFLVLYIASISPVSNALCYILEKEYLFNNDTVGKLDIVVVLGGGILDNKYLEETMPSYQTASRILYAVQVFKKTEAEYLACAGKGTGKLSEAVVMCNVAERLGIPKQSLKLDTKSINTKKHAEELNKMFTNKNLKVGLVTSAYHMKRGEKEFRKYFHNVVPMPSDYLYSSPPLSVFTVLPKSANLYRFSIAVREIIGIVWYKIKE